MTHLTIQQKLLYLFIALTSTLIFSVSVFNTSKSVDNYKKLELSFVQSIANTLKQNLASSLIFSHNDSAQELMNSFIANKNIKLLALYDKSGSLFAKLDNDHALPDLTLTQLQQGKMNVDGVGTIHIEPIQDNDETIGYIYIESNPVTLSQIIYQDLMQSILVFVMAIIATILLAKKFALSITLPIIKLSEFMNTLFETKDYDQRIYTDRQDEFKKLFENVNALLIQAQDWTQQLTENQQRLEQRVEERTIELKNAKTKLEDTVAQLVEANVVAKEASNAKSAFIANMSHEIRTPMNGILGLTEVLAETELDSRQRHLIDSIGESGELLMTIINDILDISKIESGKFKLEPKWINLRKLIEESTRYFSDLCIKKGLEYAIDLPIQKHEIFFIDGLRFKQVLYNLLSNAFKFTTKGSIKLSWRVTYQQEKAFIDLTIEDTGIGISPEKLEHIFNPFEQADVSTSRKYGGTGLGLSITQSIVKLMSGTITAQSKPNVGSSFTITVPATFQAEHPAPYQQANCYKGLKVTIISSESQNIQFLQNKMHFWGIKTQVFNHGKGALSYFKEKYACGEIDACTDLVWLDFQLGDMLSINLAAELKRLADLPILLESLSDIAGVKFIDRVEIKPVTTDATFHILSSIRNKQSIVTQQNKTISASAKYPNLSDIKLLLVEDNLTNQEFACSIFSLIQCQFDIANNGIEAIEKFENESFDLIIMDCQMPLLDGYQATTKIREIEQQKQLKRTPIIAVTAHAHASEKEKCKQAQMDDYLSKPFTINELVKSILKWTKSHSHLGQITDFDTQIGHSHQERKLPANIDPTAIENLLKLEQDGVVGALERVINKFISEAPSVLERMDAQFSSGELADLKKSAHKLKSMSASIGGKEIAQTCKLIETSPTAEIEELHEPYSALRSQYQQLLTSLDQIRKTNATS